MLGPLLFIVLLFPRGLFDQEEDSNNFLHNTTVPSFLQKPSHSVFLLHGVYKHLLNETITHVLSAGSILEAKLDIPSWVELPHEKCPKKWYVPMFSQKKMAEKEKQ